jgi:enterochelin esterase-like enzyme
MRLDGTALVLTGVGLVVLTAVLLALSWDAVRRFGRAAVVARAGIAVLCVFSVVATSLLELNRLTETYPTWAALAGEHTVANSGPAPAADSPPDSGAGASPLAPITRSLPHPSGGASQIVTLTIAGKAAGMTMPAYVYLPAAYGTATGRRERFPVIETTHGYPGSPRGWLRRLDVRAYLDREIAAGRMAPTVVVFPYQTPTALVDTECTNLTHGPRAETYLTRDVPAAIKANYRVRTDRAGWGLIGFSAGGFCSTNLILRHPAQYAAAASLSGYAEAGIHIGDGSEKTTNSPAWRLRHLPRPPIGLYLAYANDDKHSRADNLLLQRLATAPVEVTMAVVAHGGHSDAVWKSMEAPAFDWLSSWLARPVASTAGLVARPAGKLARAAGSLGRAARSAASRIKPAGL